MTGIFKREPWKSAGYRITEVRCPPGYASGVSCEFRLDRIEVRKGRCRYVYIGTYMTSELAKTAMRVDRKPKRWEYSGTGELLVGGRR